MRTCCLFVILAQRALIDWAVSPAAPSAFFGPIWIQLDMTTALLGRDCHDHPTVILGVYPQ